MQEKKVKVLDINCDLVTAKPREYILYRREPYRRVPLGRVHLDERRLDEVQ